MLFTVAPLLLALATAQNVPGFLPPLLNMFAKDSDMFPPQTGLTLAQCSTWCLNTSTCISFNLCGTDCGIQTWSMSYNPAPAENCSWYRRQIPRNDAPAPRGVPWVLEVPAPGTVNLSGGPIADAFMSNVNDYLKVRDPLDMLYWFAYRAGNPNPPGQCFGWGGWIKGSETGNFLMGAGGALQWTEDALLRANVNTVVAGIRKFQDPTTGWLWAWEESDMMDNADNLPDYCASWMTRGLLNAARAGVPDALQLARDSISLFNNHSSLPWILPQNGGPNPVQPFPSGFNNVTDGGYGQKSGHMIYIEYQGMIKHTLMALSPLGTQADVDTVADLYQENWWLEAMLAKDLFHGVWHRQFFSHNYEITGAEAFLDMYVLTGNTTYLTATLNFWEMLREHWVLPGGSMAINEGSYYPPDSYFIGFTGVHVAASHSHGHSHAHSHDAADPYVHSKCMFQPGSEDTTSRLFSADARLPAAAPAVSAAASNNNNDPPTGELCGSVFWTLFNQRFHRLYPDNETFVLEMERSILNVGLAAQGKAGSGGEGPGGRGIRYFANQHKYKQNPSFHASCCEGQGTYLFGSLPAYLFAIQTTAAGGVTVSVDIYAGASLTFPLPAACAPSSATGQLAVDTAWPYGTGAVSVSVTLPAGVSCPTLALALRMPAWLPAPVAVSLGGQPLATGQPGTYLTVPITAGGTSVLTFTLAMQLTSLRYSGSSQIAPYSRYAFLYGPVLLSMQGPWDQATDSLVLPPGLDPSQPQSLLTPSLDGNALHFNVTGAPGFTAKPYWEVQEAGELFSNYPCFH